MLPHSPSGPPPMPFAAWEHARQIPPQAESQQTPSIQKLLAHSLWPLQATPCPSLLTQAVPWQKYPVWQCESLLQLVRQRS